MKLDPQVYGLFVAVLIGWDHATPPPSPRIWAHIRWRYWSAKKIVANHWKKYRRLLSITSVERASDLKPASELMGGISCGEKWRNL